jgi:hypothetical protein
MKYFTKMSLFVVMAALLGTPAAFADNQQLQTELALRRLQYERDHKHATVALYAHGRGVGERMTHDGSRVTERRDIERHGTIMHLGRGERIVIPPSTR